MMTGSLRAFTPRILAYPCANVAYSCEYPCVAILRIRVSVRVSARIHARIRVSVRVSVYPRIRPRIRAYLRIRVRIRVSVCVSARIRSRIRPRIRVSVRVSDRILCISVPYARNDPVTPALLTSPFVAACFGWPCYRTLSNCGLCAT